MTRDEVVELFGTDTLPLPYVGTTAQYRHDGSVLVRGSNAAAAVEGMAPEERRRAVVCKE